MRERRRVRVGLVDHGTVTTAHGEEIRAVGLNTPELLVSVKDLTDDDPVEAIFAAARLTVDEARELRESLSEFIERWEPGRR